MRQLAKKPQDASQLSSCGSAASVGAFSLAAILYQWIAVPAERFTGNAQKCCANIRAMPKVPPHVKIQRAKVIVDDEGQKFLMTCDSCQKEKYIIEGQTVCEECRSKRKRKPKSWSVLWLRQMWNKLE
jgi:hypothetical protein